MNILVIHGPNFNLLGIREPSLYGTLTLNEIDSRLQDIAQERDLALRTTQSNSEGVLIDALQDARAWADGVIINPGAYSHYSYALTDAIAGVALPTIEVHLTNIYARETWRRQSVLAPVVTGVVCGLGWRGYAVAIDALIGIIQDRLSDRALDTAESNISHQLLSGNRRCPFSCPLHATGGGQPQKAPHKAKARIGQSSLGGGLGPATSGNEQKSATNASCSASLQKPLEDYASSRPTSWRPSFAARRLSSCTCCSRCRSTFYTRPQGGGSGGADEANQRMN